MSKEDFVNWLKETASITTHIKKRALELYDKIAPTLNEEDKKTAWECLVKGGFPEEEEFCFRIYFPKEWVLDKKVQDYLWNLTMNKEIRQ